MARRSLISLDYSRRMPDGPVAGLEHRDRRRRRKRFDTGVGQGVERQRRAITFEAPGQQPACRAAKALLPRPPSRRPEARAAWSRPASVTFGLLGCGGMALCMQPRVDLGDLWLGNAETPRRSSRRIPSLVSRRQSKQGRWPAASAVTSSRKNSSVQPALPLGVLRPISSRLRPLYSHSQMIQALVVQRRSSRVLRRRDRG